MPSKKLHTIAPANVTSALVAVFFGVRLWGLAESALDGDEIFGLLLARSNWHGLLQGAIKDAIHPPLFYVLLKIWVWGGGESLLWLRLFPVVVATLCLIPLFRLCRNLGVSIGARNLALAVAGVHPYALIYAQHVRMYSLLMLIGLLSVWRFQCYLDEPSEKNVLCVTIANLFLVYAQYYGWLIVGIQLLYLVWHRRQLALLLCSSVFIALAFSPWAWVALRSLRAKGG